MSVFLITPQCSVSGDRVILSTTACWAGVKATGPLPLNISFCASEGCKIMQRASKVEPTIGTKRAPCAMRTVILFATSYPLG